MADCMTFPKTADEFIEQYSFKDDKQEYTNGSELIAVFRVKQMVEHYFGKDTNVLTNADRIRAMTDEELATFLWEFDRDEIARESEFFLTKRKIGDWLKQPAEVSHD